MPLERGGLFMSNQLFGRNLLADLPDHNQTIDINADYNPAPLGYSAIPEKPRPPVRCISPGTGGKKYKSKLMNWLHQNSFTLFFGFMLAFMGLQFLLPTATFFLQGQIVVILLSCTLLIQAIRFEDHKLTMLCMACMALTLGLNGIVLAEDALGDLIFKRIIGANLMVLSLLLAVLTSVLVYHLWHNDYTGRNALFCACSSYLLIGFMWSCFYCTIAYFSDNSFSNANAISSGNGEEVLDYHRFFYFSMITLTTVGYGDITPVSPLARSLCWMEAGIGQFYFGFILARLVATQFMTNRTDKGWQHDPNTNAFKTPVPGAKVKQAA